MKQLVNKNLITLKCVIFCFFAGVGCIYPFLSLHMVSVGLERGEAQLVSAVAPCFALIGPALIGLLVDKVSVGRGSTSGSSSDGGSGKVLRVVTAACFLLGALFYSLLLLVPYTERHEARRPQVLFTCDANGTYVMQEMCTEGMRCNTWEGEKKGVLAVSACEYGCADDNMTWVMRPYVTASTTTTLRPLYNSVANATPGPEFLITEDSEDESGFETNPPHLCSESQCLVYMQHAGRMRVPLALLAPDPVQQDVSEATDSPDTPDVTPRPEDGDDPDEAVESNWCTYRSGGSSRCLVPESRLQELRAAHGPECRAAVRCRVLDPYDEPGAVLADAECRRVVGDPALTFWMYLFLRMVADMWPLSSLALVGAACVVATREKSRGRGDVGRQLAWGALAVAVAAPLAGLASRLTPDTPYLPAFLMHALFMIAGALILLIDGSMPLSTPEWWWHTASGALALPMSAARRYGPEAAAVCAVLALLGTLCAAIHVYLPWLLVDRGWEAVHVGLAVTAGALPGAALLWRAEALVDYIGHSNVFITAFILYALRLIGLESSSEYAWVLCCEAATAATLWLAWATAVLYFRHLVPRRYTTTGQALPVITHFSIGGCLGAIVGGVVRTGAAEAAWARGVAGTLAALALLTAALYLALYHLVLAPRCAAPLAVPHDLLQGLTVNGTSNGSYSPMRVYHEERSRKGHFRY